MSTANYTSVWNNGVLEFRDSSGRVVDLVTANAVNEDFLGVAVNTTNDWTFAAVNSGAIARTAGAGGIARITTGAADDDDADLATPLNYLPSKGCSLEVRFATNDAAGTGFNVGFSDATGEAADLIAITYSGTTLTSTASDFAGFFHDADATTDAIRAVAVKADADGTVYDSGSVAVNATYNVYRVDINQDGDAIDVNHYDTKAEAMQHFDRWDESGESVAVVVEKHTSPGNRIDGRTGQSDYHLLAARGSQKALRAGGWIATS